MEVPIIFSVDRKNETGYGLAAFKELGDPYIHLTKEDPYETRVIKLNFNQLANMIDELRAAETEEFEKRVVLMGKD